VLQSRSGDLIARGIRYANPIMPEDIRTYLGKYIDEFDAKLHEPPAEAAPSPGESVPGKGVAPAAPAPTVPPAADPGSKSGTPKKTLRDRLLPGK
jgi:hypothetical protein